LSHLSSTGIILTHAATADIQPSTNQPRYPARRPELSCGTATNPFATVHAFSRRRLQEGQLFRGGRAWNPVSLREAELPAVVPSHVEAIGGEGVFSVAGKEPSRMLDQVMKPADMVAAVSKSKLKPNFKPCTTN
jgi:hypothetical protein